VPPEICNKNILKINGLGFEQKFCKSRTLASSSRSSIQLRPRNSSVLGFLSGRFQPILAGPGSQVNPGLPLNVVYYIVGMTEHLDDVPADSPICFMHWLFQF